MTDDLHATPGPWTAVRLDEPSRTYPGAMAMVYGPDGDAVAAVFGNLAEEGEAYKNAVLMAAAPKMVKALVEARQFIFDAFGMNTGLANAVVQGNGIDAALDAAGVKLP
jgi:hypothetical protein